MLVIDRKLLGPDGMPGPELLGTLLRRHAQERVRLDEIGEIYARRHRITSRRRLAGLPNNRLAHDLPGYIATMAAGYLVGSPVRYAPPDGQEDAFEAVRRAYGEASVESVDAELAMDAAVYGKAVELCYADALARPRVAQMDPRSSFVVYDDTVEHAPLFGVACRDLMDEQLRRRGERISVYGPHIIRHFERVGSETPREAGSQDSEIARRAHGRILEQRPRTGRFRAGHGPDRRLRRAPERPRQRQAAVHRRGVRAQGRGRAGHRPTPRRWRTPATAWRRSRPRSRPPRTPACACAGPGRCSCPATGPTRSS